jgi:ribonuclease HI
MTIYNMSSLPIEIYTDGSCMKTLKGNLLCGYGVYFPGKEYRDISRRFKVKPLTNQRTELYAIYKAIRRVYKHDKTKDIIIYSDSEYSIKCVTVWITQWKKNNWRTANRKEVLNQDLIMKIDKIMGKYRGTIKFIHVRAHTGKQDKLSINNDIVDKLAKAGARKNIIKV